MKVQCLNHGAMTAALYLLGDIPNLSCTVISTVQKIIRRALVSVHTSFRDTALHPPTSDRV